MSPYRLQPGLRPPFHSPVDTVSTGTCFDRLSTRRHLRRVFTGAVRKRALFASPLPLGLQPSGTPVDRHHLGARRARRGPRGPAARHSRIERLPVDSAGGTGDAASRDATVQRRPDGPYALQHAPHAGAASRFALPHSAKPARRDPQHRRHAERPGLLRQLGGGPPKRHGRAAPRRTEEVKDALGG